VVCSGTADRDDLVMLLQGIRSIEAQRIALSPPVSL